MSAKKILVRQVRSGNRCPKEQKATLKALGLGKIGSKREHTYDPTVAGMLRAVSHLVLIDQA